MGSLGWWWIPRPQALRPLLACSVMPPGGVCLGLAARGPRASVAPGARSKRRRGGREHLLGRRHARPPRHGVALLRETLLQRGEDEQDIVWLTRVAHQPDAPDLALEITQPPTDLQV